MIEQAITTLENAGFVAVLNNMEIVVMLSRVVGIMEVKFVLDAAGIEARYHRAGGSVVVRL
jgi:hypothetical protein